MASDEPARDHHHSSEEEEEAPSPGSPTDSRQGDLVSFCEERKARRDNLKEANKRSLNDEVENKENKTKRKAKSKDDHRWNSTKMPITVHDIKFRYWPDY